MPTVIPVKFAYAARDLWFDPVGTDAVEGDHVICATERGTEMGLATGDPFEVDQAEYNRKTDGAKLKSVIRVATDEDYGRADKLAERSDRAFPTFRRLVSKSGLDMKPVAVEYLFGGEKVVCYFSADDRIDFRQLVRDLSRELHERVDMRQIGVREEAALMGGFGHCGQELCCTRFGSGFEPVSIRMAKEQDLPLNSNKISGACGRLMCCLRYEFEAYRDFKQRAPKKNAVIQTPLGTAKIVEYDTPKEQLALRLENGKQIRVPLAEMEASDAAKKKSEELGCPCRPDTVLRSTMDRLASPEVRAALEEIDRKNGLIPEETVAAEDLFVTEGRSGRRRRNKGGNKGGRSEATEAMQAPSAEGETTRRRRRHKTVEVAIDDAQNLPGQSDASSAKKSAPGEGRRSRRRHHSEQEAGEQREEQQPTSRRERRHNVQKGEGEQSQRPQREQRAKQEQAEGGEQRSPRRRRRRPGDKGGAAAQAQQQRRDEVGEQRKPRQKPKHMASEGGSAPAEGNASAGEGAPKRRRRRRRRGGGNGGEQGGKPEAPSAE